MFSRGGFDAKKKRRRLPGTHTAPEAFAGGDPDKALVLSYVGRLATGGFAIWKLLDNGEIGSSPGLWRDLPFVANNHPPDRLTLQESGPRPRRPAFSFALCRSRSFLDLTASTGVWRRMG